MKLSRAGGQNLSDGVRGIMRRLMTDELALQFNWKGSRGGKVGFEQKALLSVIHGIIFASRR